MPEAAFVHSFAVRLHDTDAAGVLFFGHLFRHAHDAYEGLMDLLGVPLNSLIPNGLGTGTRAATGDADGATPLPITRAQARYLRPLGLGDRVRVEVRIADLRRRSFAVEYRFIDARGGLAAEAQTVHCLADPQAPTLPDRLWNALAGARAPDETIGA